MIGVARAALCIGLLALSTCTRAAPSQTTVAAASSLRELLEATRHRFEKQHLGASLAFSFDASSALSRQIEAGSGFEVFLSADRENVERLGDKVDRERTKAFMSNRLALVARAGLEEKATDLESLRGKPGKIAI